MIITLLALIIILALLAGIISYVKDKDGEIIVSSIGGIMLGINVVLQETELQDEDDPNKFTPCTQHFIHVALLFISLTFIYYVNNE